MERNALDHLYFTKELLSKQYHPKGFYLGHKCLWTLAPANRMQQEETKPKARFKPTLSKMYEILVHIIRQKNHGLAYLKQKAMTFFS